MIPPLQLLRAPSIAKEHAAVLFFILGSQIHYSAEKSYEKKEDRKCTAP